jgi:D-glycero-D-manno-heptose 1,7-bisphosphate phosphatase
MFPAIFLDRDGVLIENRADYVSNWSQVVMFHDAINALSNTDLNNYKIVIVTNQSAVGRGIISLETAQHINDRLISEIRRQKGKIDGVYLCPHDPDHGCDCRKPKPGLLLQAAKELSLDLKRSWMIGDAWSDVQAGQAAGVLGSIIVKTGRGKEQLSMNQPGGFKDYQISNDLPHALATILANDRGK